MMTSKPVTYSIPDASKPVETCSLGYPPITQNCNRRRRGKKLNADLLTTYEKGLLNQTNRRYSLYHILPPSVEPTQQENFDIQTIKQPDIKESKSDWSKVVFNIGSISSLLQHQKRQQRACYERNTSKRYEVHFQKIEKFLASNQLPVSVARPTTGPHSASRVHDADGDQSRPRTVATGVGLALRKISVPTVCPRYLQHHVRRPARMFDPEELRILTREYREKQKLQSRCLKKLVH